MRILFASSEVLPYSKSGGLADVASALPAALGRLGHEVVIVTPRYTQIDVATWDLRRRRFRLNPPIHGKGVQGGLLEAVSPAGVPIWFIDQPGFFERPGLYGEGGRDYPDNDERFGFFCHALLEACRAMDWAPDIIHLNDWQTGPVAPLLQHHYRDWPELNVAGTVFTIHNLGYQGLFAPNAMMALGLDWNLFTPSTLEYFGKVSYIKAGLVFADKLTTVSPRYAKEIQTAEFGFGLEGLLRDRSADLHGILNGADYDTWDPNHDPHIAQHYSADDLAGKAACKADLQKALGLPLNGDTALIGCTSRLSEQKGIDLLVDAAGALLELDCQVVILGEGDPALERRLTALAESAPHRLAFTRGYDEALAHRIQAGADLFLVPSRYEPCGLTQIYAMRYGTLPIVRAVGGLDDTVDDVDADDGLGFKFAPATGEAALETVKRALAHYTDRSSWTRLMRGAMGLRFSWDLPARRYAHLYRQVCDLRNPE